MDSKEIMKRFLEEIGENPNSLGRKLGARDGTKIYYVLNGRNKMSKELADKIKNEYPWVSWEWLIKGYGEMYENGKPKNSQGKKLLLDIEATSNITNDIPSEGSFYYNMKGDSMVPEIQPGDILGCSVVDKNSVLEYGKKFIIQTKNGLIVRKLMPSRNTDTFMLESPEEKNYPPIQVKIEDILKIAIVNNYLRMV